MPMNSPSDDAYRRPSAAPAEPPRNEPEIIPPGADFPPRSRAEGIVFTRHGTRIQVRRLGPFGIAMLLLGAGALGAIGLLMLLGALLVGAAVMGVIVVAALLSQLLRGPAR